MTEHEPSNWFENIRDKLHGMYARSDTTDVVTGVHTKWSKSDDGTHYSRSDVFPHSGPSRYIHETNMPTLYLRRNSIRRSEGEDTLGIAVVQLREATTLEVNVSHNPLESRHPFESVAVYNDLGLLHEISFEHRPLTNEWDNDDGETVLFNEERVKKPEQYLMEFVGVFHLMGQEPFKAAEMFGGNTDGHLDFSDPIPTLPITDTLRNSNWTEDGVNHAVTLVSAKVKDYLKRTILQDGLNDEELQVMSQFLGVITAERIIYEKFYPEQIHENAITIEFSDHQIIGHLLYATKFLQKNYKASLEMKGKAVVHILVDSTDPKELLFQVTNPGTGQGREIITSEELHFGQRKRHEQYQYMIEQTEDSYVLRVNSLIHPAYSSTATFPKTVDIAAIRKAIDTEESTGWEKAFDLVPAASVN